MTEVTDIPPLDENGYPYYDISGEKKETAVEWLLKNIPQRFANAFMNQCRDEITEAKRMEEEQRVRDMGEAFEAGMKFIAENKGSWEEFIESKKR